MIQLSRTSAAWMVSLGLVGVLIGFGTYIIITSRSSSELLKKYSYSLLLIINSAGSLTYGIIESVDQNTGTIRLYSPVWYGNEKVERHLTVKLTSDPLVMRQELIGEGDVYTSISERTPISLSDIRPGERAAILIRVQDNGTMEADLAIVGNPL